jgi:predicted RNA-binding protein YlxR (DUF448 family)
MCVACRTRRDREGLVRLVRIDGEGVQIDLEGRLPGRGAYLCRTEACWALAQRRRSLERALAVRLDPQKWQNLVASRPPDRDLS